MYSTVNWPKEATTILRLSTSLRPSTPPSLRYCVLPSHYPSVTLSLHLFVILSLYPSAHLSSILEFVCSSVTPAHQSFPVHLLKKVSLFLRSFLFRSSTCLSLYKSLCSVVPLVFLCPLVPVSLTNCPSIYLSHCLSLSPSLSLCSSVYLSLCSSVPMSIRSSASLCTSVPLYIICPSVDLCYATRYMVYRVVIWFDPWLAIAFVTPQATSPFYPDRCSVHHKTCLLQEVLFSLV